MSGEGVCYESEVWTRGTDKVPEYADSWTDGVFGVVQNRFIRKRCV